ncbi:Uncharacterised protein [Akkermansia muciniphila]|uniref:Uncharacterized protein n=1 Tax=Akkermansia muciniphila TaxID=239935 RepID=A0A6N2SWL9_9BACT
MEALAVDENGAASQRIPRAESRPVGIGTHIFPVSEQFQTAGEIGIARIGDVDLSRGIRRPNGDGARAVKLGVQVDGSAGEGQRGAFTYADDGGVIGVHADGRSAREGKRSLFHGEVGQGIPGVSQRQRAVPRLGQRGARAHDVSRQSGPGDSVPCPDYGNVQSASVSNLDAAGNVISRHVPTGGGVRISQRTAVKGNVTRRTQRVVRSDGKSASVEHCATGVGIRQVQGDVGRAVHGERSGGNGVRNITRVVRITDQRVSAAVEDDALGSHGTGDLHFTRFRSGEIDFLVVQRVHARQLGGPAVNAGVDPLAVRSTVPDKTVVSADVHDFQHELVVFHHDGVFKAFPGDVRRPGEGIRGQAARRSPLGQDVVGCFQFTIVVDGQRAVGIRQSQGPCLDIDDRAVCHDSGHVKGQRSAAVQRQGGGRGHFGARAHGDAAQGHGVRIRECQRAGLDVRQARVGILPGEGQRAGTHFRQAAGAGKDAPEGDVGGSLVIV